MSQSESPVPTEAQQILDKLGQVILNQEAIIATQKRHGDEINGLGQNLAWIIEQTQGIFQMFGNPQALAMLGPALNGAMAGMGVPTDGG